MSTVNPRFRTAIVAAAIASLIAASCGSDSTSSSSDSDATEPEPTQTSSVSDEGVDASTADEAWSFTDDFGDTVELSARPQRVVMFEDVAASLMDLGARPVGIHYINRVGGNRLFEGIDMEGIAEVGATCEEVNLEAVAATQPDLIIYMHWGNDDDAAFCITGEQRALLEEIAPMVRMQSVGQSDLILQRYEELATALGADLDAPEIATKRERYEAAATQLEGALAANPEIDIIAVSISADWAGVAEPTGIADLTTLQDRFGVQFQGPFSGPFTGEYWEQMSNETITQYRGDMILIDSKNATPIQEKLDGQHIWATLDEVKAGQFVPWFVPGSFSYTRDAVFMETLADAIENAEDFVN